MRVNLDKHFDKDVFHTIKRAIGYAPKLAWNKISHANFCKLAQISKKVDDFVQIIDYRFTDYRLFT